MHPSSRLGRLTVVFAALIGLTLSGCSSKESKWEGTYQADQDSTMVIEIDPNHKAVFKDPSGNKEGTWEMSGDDKITIHGEMGSVDLFRNADGTYRDTMSGTWKKK